MKPACMQAPSVWVQRWAGLIPPPGPVLDLACGMGRHTVYLSGLGLEVTAVDLDMDQSEAVRPLAGVTWLRRDMEAGDWPFPVGHWSGIVVSNYLHRPLLPHLLAGLAPGGVLIYTTFAHGQQVFGRPGNPAHLLMPGELLEWVRGHLRVIAYEDVQETAPVPARRQRLVARRPE